MADGPNAFATDGNSTHSCGSPHRQMELLEIARAMNCLSVSGNFWATALSPEPVKLDPLFVGTLDSGFRVLEPHCNNAP
jgi:hypothetical protein